MAIIPHPGMFNWHSVERMSDSRLGHGGDRLAAPGNGGILGRGVRSADVVDGYGKGPSERFYSDSKQLSRPHKRRGCCSSVPAF